MKKKAEELKKYTAWLIRDKYAGEAEPKWLERDILRLKSGEPIDYVIGWKEFLGCKIDLSKRPLIPREETEYWVGEVIKGKIQSGPIKILDLFAGSGCIGIALLKHLPNAQVTFGEKDSNLLEQIKLNCKINNIEKGRYKVRETNVFSNIKSKYDYIFANPPYLAKELEKRVQKSVKDWEPARALWGGQDGLFYIKKFLKAAPSFLTKKGKIFLEFDHPQKESISSLMKLFDYRAYTFHRDQFGRYRWLEIDNKY